MSKLPTIAFSKPNSTIKTNAIFLVQKDGGLGKIATELDKSGQLARAIKAADFKGAHKSSVELAAAEGGEAKWLVAGCGDVDAQSEDGWMKLGGKIFAAMKGHAAATVVCELDDGQISPEGCAAMAAGAKLAAYEFKQYKTKTASDEKPSKPMKLTFMHPELTAVRRQWKRMDGVCDGVMLARDLVNEPANVLGPVEFANRTKELTKLGVKIQILGDKELKAQKMGALLGVAQGSVRPSRVVVMQWSGGKAKDQPVAFVGKGVTFDSGGISLKPGGGMEDMKGDMGGAAAVTGLIHALAARNAKANVIGIIGLVENMPDGNAQRPSDIVQSMSGQTIEIINTDAEGRLVLADALWYCQKRFKPKFMINLATLTGAIIVALGKSYAGMFSNDDELAANIDAAGGKTNERVWRMPLDADYDKLIDSQFADMKNSGGRLAGSCTAGQFLHRFVNDVPWAHLDIAGTAMGSPKHEYNRSWGSGFGVRLLDRLVADHYE